MSEDYIASIFNVESKPSEKSAEEGASCSWSSTLKVEAVF
jgi:hypothetical protein